MHLFSYKGPEGRYALLAQNAPESLPEQWGPWKRLGEVELNPGDPDQLGVPTLQALANIETHGCYIFQLTMTFE